MSHSSSVCRSSGFWFLRFPSCTVRLLLDRPSLHSYSHRLLNSIYHSSLLSFLIDKTGAERRTNPRTIATMAFNESGRKKYIEQPELQHLSQETLENPPKQRTVQQQEKQDNLIKQEKRQEGLEGPRSRSASRRDRRKRIRQQIDDGKHMHTAPLEALEEADANQDLAAMQPFERIGPDSTSMDGPVTMARAMRGEIPVRGSNPNQPYYIKPEETQDVSAVAF